MFVAFNKPEEALPKYFDYYFNGLKVGHVISMTGSPTLKMGGGKSWTSCKLGEVIDPNFSIDNIVYYPKDFLEVMDRVEERGKVGQVVVVDESEITAPAQMYHQFANKAMSYTLSTFRYLRCMSIMVTPSFSFIDKRIRTLVSHIGYPEKRYVGGAEGRSEVYLRLYRLSTDLFGDKLYLNRIKMYDKSDPDPLRHRVVSFKEFKIGRISESLEVDYEKKSHEFKESLRKRLLPELAKWDAYQFNEEKKTADEIIKDITENTKILEELTTKRGKVDVNLVLDKYPNLTNREGKKIKRTFEKMYAGTKL